MADKSDTRRKLVVIEEGTLVGMATNPAITKEFPFLANIGRQARSKTKASCGTCGRRSAERAAIYTAAKQAIAGMSSDKKRRLKELLNTKSARVVFKGSGSKYTELTF